MHVPETVQPSRILKSRPVRRPGMLLEKITNTRSKIRSHESTGTFLPLSFFVYNSKKVLCRPDKSLKFNCKRWHLVKRLKILKEFDQKVKIIRLASIVKILVRKINIEGRIGQNLWGTRLSMFFIA